MNYTPFLLNQYGGKENPNLFAVHFKKLGVYNRDWDLSHILVYELMLVMSRKTGNTEFYKQIHKIMEDTRLGRHKVRKAIEFLETKGILNTSRSQGGKTYYSINYSWIKENLDKVYDFTNVPDNEIEPLSRLLKTFINYHSNTEYYENKPESKQLDASDIPEEQTQIIDPEEE